MYQQVLTPVAGSLSLSALVAAVPIIVLFAMLGVFKVAARWSALASLIAALVIAVAVFHMPAVQSLSAAGEGAAIGFFPIIWVGINAIWLYNLTEASGHFAVLRRTFNTVTDDRAGQVIIIAFCFGALLEALAGGGSPVAICSVMLLAAGFDPVKAAAVCLIADTSPVAFGALGQPITVLSTLTGLPVHDLATMVGRQTPFLALVIPFILVVITEGRSGLRRSWVVALTAGLSFAVCQSALSTSVSPQLVDMLAALIATACTMTVLRLRRASLHAPAPAGAVPVTATGPATSGVAVASADPAATVTADSATERARAFAPYVLVMLVVAAAQLPALQSLWDATTTKFSWPGLHVLANSGKAVTATNASFTWLNNPGSLALIAGVLCAPILGLGPVRAGVTYLKTLHQLRWAIFTVCCVVGLSYVMNLSGQTITLGVWLAGAGVLFPFVSPLIGWLGTALTGSDTSTNTLFGTLQVTTAHSTGLSATLLAAANSSGGVMGKAISPQNLTIAAVAVGMAGNESILFRRVVGWTALLAGLLALLVFLQSTPVLSWLVP